MPKKKDEGHCSISGYSVTLKEQSFKGALSCRAEISVKLALCSIGLGPTFIPFQRCKYTLSFLANLSVLGDVPTSFDWHIYSFDRIFFICASLILGLLILLASLCNIVYVTTYLLNFLKCHKSAHSGKPYFPRHISNFQQMHLYCHTT